MKPRIRNLSGSGFCWGQEPPLSGLQAGPDGQRAGSFLQDEEGSRFFVRAVP